MIATKLLFKELGLYWFVINDNNKIVSTKKNLLKPYIIKVIVSILQLLNRIDWDNTALFTTSMKEKDLWLLKNQGKLQTFDLFWCI